MHSYQSALIGLGATWLVICITTLATYDPAVGYAKVTLAFLLVMSVFSITQAVRYSRLLKQARIKAQTREDEIL